MQGFFRNPLCLMEQFVKTFFSRLWQTLLSLLKISLKSCLRTPLPRPSSAEGELLILANGPSLTQTVEAHPSFLQGKDLLAVNHAAVSDLFVRLRPRYYLLADPLFWIDPAIRDRTFGALAARTTWPMTLFMPMRAWKDRTWQPLVAQNPQIRVVKYNSTPVEGFPGFCNLVYKLGLGMPRPHNVLIPSIAVAVRMGYRRVYLAGADHSWLPEITVNDRNEVLMNQKHFYDRGRSEARAVRNENLTTATLSTILHHMSVAFGSYFVLRDFARSCGAEVINVTPGSFIDAFPRLQLPPEPRG